MRSWTILALLVAIGAVLLGVGHTDRTAKLDAFEEQPAEDTENEEQLVDSFVNRKNEDDNDDDDDKSENALESVDAAPPDDEDEAALFKRAPWRRRRRRRFFRIRRIRIRVRRAIKKVCKWVYVSGHVGWIYKCYWVKKLFGDEESPR